jgi:Protein of unknown function (DUF3689)
VLIDIFPKLLWNRVRPANAPAAPRLHGPNCECNSESALRVQYLRLLHNLIDKESMSSNSTSTSSSSNSSSASGASSKRLLLTPTQRALLLVPQETAGLAEAELEAWERYASYTLRTLRLKELYPHALENFPGTSSCCTSLQLLQSGALCDVPVVAWVFLVICEQ